MVVRSLGHFGFGLVRDIDPARRNEGKDWPSVAFTMVGIKRLDNIQSCVERVIEEEVPGDLVEAGVWRGGASMFMRAILKAYGISDRVVWAADSFKGLPRAERGVVADRGDVHHAKAYLRVSLEEVRSNFARLDLLDDQVRFLMGWFEDTLPNAGIDRIAVLRADGDMYKSTMDILGSLYDKVSPGGFVIIDDYGALRQCRRAVHDFREANGITEEIVPIDWTGVYWRRA